MEFSNEILSKPELSNGKQLSHCFLSNLVPDTVKVVPIQATLMSSLFMLLYIAILNIILSTSFELYDRVFAVILIEAFANLIRSPLVIYFAV